MTHAGMDPDPWQKSLLHCFDSRILLCCGRQAGKSLVAAALALYTAICRPDSLVLLLSPGERQSKELFQDKLMRLYQALGRPVKARQETALTLSLKNGSRVIALPGKEGTIRGYSGVTLLAIDEASLVPDSLYYATRPMLAVSGGRLIAMSTPRGKRGFFYEEWASERKWRRINIKSTQCPRVTPEFLAEEKESLGERWFRQEYLTSFEDAIDAVFSESDIQSACNNATAPLW